MAVHRLAVDTAAGNPLYLTELIRFGVATGRLSQVGGVWWWPGDTEVPPRLGELLQRRIEDVTPSAAEARDVLALGEPLPYDILAAVVSSEAIMELDEQGIVTSDSGEGQVLLRFSHPLLFAVAARRLSPARRRALAGRLLDAPAEHVDLLRRAAWQEAAGGRPDVDLLVRASRSLIVTDPATPIRFAERAIGYDDGPAAAVTLADAQAEAGRPDEARASLTVAASRGRNPDDRAMVGLSEAGLTLWSLRRPEEAVAVLARLEGDVPADLVAEPRSAPALLTLFSAQPAAARRIAEEMLAGPLPPDARRRCLMVRLAALMVGDRPDEAQQAGTELTILLRTHPTPPSARSLSTAIAATAELFGNRSGELPRAAGSTGRWPTPLDPMASSGRDGGGSPLPGPVWPLLEGVRHHLAGDCAAAAVSLREATVQQLAGEGLFRSEATGGLVVVLAETGHLAEARKVLADNGPDARWVRISPLPDWPGSGPRAANRAEPLVAAAEAHLAVGLLGHALELADLAGDRAQRARGRSADAAAARAGAVAALARRTLGTADARGAELPEQLTRREAEIAQLAAQGMRDKDIADELVLSVRTVESHLATAYRKLGIASRRELVEALGNQPHTGSVP